LHNTVKKNKKQKTNKQTKKKPASNCGDFTSYIMLKTTLTATNCGHLSDPSSGVK